MIIGIATTGLVTALSMSEMQIQPAYSQATHCTTTGLSSRCVTPGQDPSLSICFRELCIPGPEVTHQQAGRSIGEGHQACAKGLLECTVTPPEKNGVE